MSATKISLVQSGHNKPPRVEPGIKAAPKIRQLYWCELWEDARLPEMWKQRPVITVSYKNTLYGPCTVIPTSTDPDNEANPWAYRLPEIQGCRSSWAICNHLMTISPSRLSQMNGKIPKLPQGDFDEVLKRMLRWLPSLQA